MKVQILTPLAGPAQVLAAGDVVEVSDDEGARLVAAGFAAEAAPAPAPPKKRPPRKRAAKPAGS